MIMINLGSTAQVMAFLPYRQRVTDPAMMTEGFRISDRSTRARRTSSLNDCFEKLSWTFSHSRSSLEKNALHLVHTYPLLGAVETTFLELQASATATSLVLPDDQNVIVTGGRNPVYSTIRM